LRYPQIPKLSDRTIRQNPPLDRDFKLADGGGMYLLVRANKQHGWRFKYRLNGKEKLISFGPYPAVSLAKARGELKRAKSLLRRGSIPASRAKAEKMPVPIRSSRSPENGWREAGRSGARAMRKRLSADLNAIFSRGLASSPSRSYAPRTCWRV
jgi:hypothetical protein